MAFIDYFPSIMTPTKEQVDAIQRIEDAVNSGVDNIILCAPTGIGKSPIAAGIGSAMGSACIITPQKILQNQYESKFPWIYPMKGKSNFLCLDLWEPETCSLVEAKSKKELRCNHGVCVKSEKNDEGKNIFVDCKYKPDILNYSVQGEGESQTVIGPDNMCHYYDTKNKALHALHTVFNYPSYFQTVQNRAQFDSYLERDCLIADEAHEIEENLVTFNQYELPKSILKDTNENLEQYNLDDIDSMLKLLTNLKNHYQTQLENLENEKTDIKIINNLSKQLTNSEKIYSHLFNNAENFVIQKNKDQSKGIVLTIKPLEIKNYVKEYFDYSTQIFMSATINKEMFCETMGFDESECTFIEIEKSPFDKEHRKIEFLNIDSMSGKSTKQIIEISTNPVKELLKKHQDHRGLILMTSKVQCDGLAEALEQEWLRIKVVHSDTNDDKDQVIKEHEVSNKDEVLLSPSLWQGIDLKGDLSRFQIIVKTPFLPIGDKRIEVKSKSNWKWYQYAALVKLLQGFGRSVRDVDDHAITYVLDTKALQLIIDMKKYIPKSFHDILPLD